MTILVIGLIVFFGTHLISKTPLRAASSASLGENRFKLGYSLLSAIGFGLIVWGFLRVRNGPADADLVWDPPYALRHVTMLLTLLAFICIAAFWHRGRLKLWLRNPFSIGIALWSLGHLLANGQRSHVYLFGAFFLYALIDIVSNEMKGYRPQFAPKSVHDVIAVVAGLLLYAVFLFGFHPYVLQLPVFE